MKRTYNIVLGLFAVGGLACQDSVPIQPASLDGPTAITSTLGRVCLTTREDSGRIIPKFQACVTSDDAKTPYEGGVGLVVNENSDRLSFFDIGRSPELANLNESIPGVSHLPVGRLPVDVAASPDGTVAYTLNQIDMDISIVNLWGPSVVPQRLSLARTPIAFDVRKNNGEIVAVMDAPSRLVVLGGATCDDETTCEVSDAEPRSLELRGTVTDLAVAPDGSRAYIAYRDLDEIDVVGLDTLQITDSVAVAFECNDGIDNDGDGFIDQKDSLCYGPNGAESLGGMGRDEQRDCADLVDNDNDGLIDREDPDCVSSTGSEEPGGVVPVTQCNDGIDNDGDGQADYPGDPNCYGAFGRTEQPIVQRGFEAIDIDPLGAFVYAVDRARNQVIVIDATRNRLVDVSASSEPSGKSFNSNLGLLTSPSPLDVTATVRRDCVTEENGVGACTEAFFSGDPENAADEGYTKDTVVVRYQYKGWVSEDSGRLRALEVMETFCEIPTNEAIYGSENGEIALTTPFSDLARYAASEESNCFTVPEFPLQPRDDWQGECEVECGTDCAEALMKSRYFCSEGTGVLVNPRMGLLDADGAFARTSGKGRCEIPQTVSIQMREFAAEANTARNFRCTSMLLPQPLVLEVNDLDRNAYDSLLEFERADLISYAATFFGFLEGNIEVGTAVRPFDEKIVSEGWTVEFEGVLPTSRRADGLLATETVDVGGRETVAFSAGSLDLCRAGIEVGDILTITSAPTDLANCSEFDSKEDEFLSFEIISRSAGDYVLGLVDPADSSTEFVQVLPTRECFQTGTSYRVRPHDEWIVYGSRSGLIPNKEALFGECVPAFGTAEQEANPDRQTPTRASRVKTGEVFHGPYLSFYLFPGPDRLEDGEPVPDEPAVTPERGLVFNFDIDTNFISRSLKTEGVFPSKLDMYEVGGQYRVVSSDANANFIFYKSVRLAGEEGSRLR